MNAATDADVNKAGLDSFPNDFFGKIIADLEKPGTASATVLSRLKGDTWKRLCSYTHTGYMQIGARLTPEGLGYCYEELEITGVLRVADSIALATTIVLADLIGDAELQIDALNRLRSM